MRSFRSAVLVVVLLALLLTAFGVAAGGATGEVGSGPGMTGESTAAIDGSVSQAYDGSVSPAIEPTSSIDVDDAIGVRHELAATDEQGTVSVTTTLTVPERVTDLKVTLRSANDRPIRADGFDRSGTDAGDSVWEWDGRTDEPTLSYRMDANVTADARGPLAETGTYRFVDAGEWAIVRTPHVDVTGRFTGTEGIGLDREVVVRGDGTAGESLAFLGTYDEYGHEANGQRFRLIVPHAAESVATPSAVFDAFEYASTALRVGARDETVVAVAAPSDGVDWGSRGLQIGDADMWVLDDEPPSTAEDVWTHEYVHTRQAYVADESARWFTEATATYYAALFAVERGEADFDEFERTLAAGERSPDAEAILADPSTWESPADYRKGALVAGEIDRQLRLATDGEASLATVFRELNADPEPISNEAILDAIAAAAAAGADEETAETIRADARELTTTERAPLVWDRDAHEAAFGETPAQVGYAIDADGVSAVGPYRDRPVDRDPVHLVAEETLAVTLTASNTGGVAGEYEATMVVDGEPVATGSGTVDPDVEVTERLEHRFDEPGEYEVRIGTETLEVVVSEPADVVVRDVAVEPNELEVGESVDVTAALGNDAGVPARSDVEFRVDGDVVAVETVRLDTAAETELSRAITIDGTGPTTVSVVASGSESSATVDVQGPDATDPIGETVEEVPGFGPITVAVALFVGALALLRRRV